MQKIEYNEELDNQESAITQTSSKLALPGAIIVAGVLIAGAILITKLPPAQIAAPVDQGNTAPAGDLKKLIPISQNDHILGSSPDNKVYIVEFSDSECPFCQRFHTTMHQVVDAYRGKVAWVYRHFPLDSIHPKTRKEAEASECAAELGGNEAFWKFMDRIFEVTPANNQLDPNELYNIAKYVGLDSVAFKACLDSGKYASKIEAQYQDGINVGVTGTPMSVIVYKDKKVSLSGAQPLEAVKAQIDALLK
jgi:protein-disulfide isomerase